MRNGRSNALRGGIKPILHVKAGRQEHVVVELDPPLGEPWIWREIDTPTRNDT